METILHHNDRHQEVNMLLIIFFITKKIIFKIKNVNDREPQLIMKQYKMNLIHYHLIARPPIMIILQIVFYQI
jgi:hypothetical protein